MIDKLKLMVLLIGIRDEDLEAFMMIIAIDIILYLNINIII